MIMILILTTFTPTLYFPAGLFVGVLSLDVSLMVLPWIRICNGIDRKHKSNKNLLETPPPKTLGKQMRYLPR